MYRAGVEGILGLRREGSALVVDPYLPPDWPEFSATLNVAGTRHEIAVRSGSLAPGSSPSARLDGVALLRRNGSIRVPLDGGDHMLDIDIEPSI